MMVSGAWAGASLMPVADDAQVRASQTVRSLAGSVVKAPRVAPATSPATDAASPAPAIAPASLADGQVLAGAAKSSIAPRPADYGGRWERSKAKCATLSENTLTAALDDPAEIGDHLASAGSPWPENPNCIYMGGFGIGPMNPVSSFDETLGLWVRAVALRDRQGDDLVMVVLDGEGYLWDYAKKCTDCGVKQIAATLAADPALGLEADDIVVSATHAHSSPDFIGGWGFVPDWYMKQVSDTIKSTIRAAIAKQKPAVLEYGERTARGYNSERRDTYRSAEEQQLAWLRAYVPGPGNAGKGETVATLGAYAAHPTAYGTNGGTAHPDWPGVFEKSLEDRFGGIGLHFMTGLGNVSNSGLRDHAKTGNLAGLVGGIGEGDLIENPDIQTAQKTWVQPATNVPLTALGIPGFFDREFKNGAATVQTGENPEKFQCVSASPAGVEVAVSAMRIGPEFALTAAPGETFSNFSNTLKEKSGAVVTMPLGQANDALGYMPQSFEMNQVAQQGLGFAGELNGYAFVNYEDSYAIDKCFGDMALETSIGLLDGLK